MLLKRWNALPPSARKAAVDVLLQARRGTPPCSTRWRRARSPAATLPPSRRSTVAVAADPAAADRGKKLLAVAGRLPDADRQS